METNTQIPVTPQIANNIPSKVIINQRTVRPPSKKTLYRKVLFVTFNTNKVFYGNEPELPQWIDRLKKYVIAFAQDESLEKFVKFTDAYRDAYYDDKYVKDCNIEGVPQIGHKENRLHIHFVIVFRSWANIAISGSEVFRHYNAHLSKIASEHFPEIGEMTRNGQPGKPYINLQSGKDTVVTLQDYMLKGAIKN